MQMDNKTKENYAKIIGQRINSALAKANKMQKDLASHLGVTDNTVSYYCSGSRTPNTAQIIEISKFLNVSADYLLGLSDIQTSNIDKKEICRRLHIPDEMYEILRHLFLNFSPASFVMYSEDDYYIDPENPFPKLLELYLYEKAKENEDKQPETVTLRYIIVKTILERLDFFDSITTATACNMVAKATKDRFIRQEDKCADMQESLNSPNDNKEYIECVKELSSIGDECRRNNDMADAKEWQMQKILLEIFNLICDEINEKYYISNGDLYELATNELVEKGVLEGYET